MARCIAMCYNLRLVLRIGIPALKLIDEVQNCRLCWSLGEFRLVDWCFSIVTPCTMRRQVLERMKAIKWQEEEIDYSVEPSATQIHV